MQATSPSDTTGLLHHNHNSNIAPQHIFDNVGLSSDSFGSPNLPSLLRQLTPSGSPSNGTNTASLESSQSYDAVVSHNNQLRTRVSELEVINELFRGRVAELESTEKEARTNEAVKEAEVQRLKHELEATTARAAELEKRVLGFESENGDGPARKKLRTDAA